MYHQHFRTKEKRMCSKREGQRILLAREAYAIKLTSGNKDKSIRETDTSRNVGQ